MVMPWHYRPDHDFDPLYDGDEPEETWEYNAISNSMAWLSAKLVPEWCQSPEHWTTRLVLYLWADCACCLFFRGASLGFVAGLVVAAIAVIINRLIGGY